jgi:predicted aspartyl protease
MWILLLAAVGLVSASCVAVSSPTGPRDAQPGEVRFELAGPGGAAVVVPVTINGAGPFPFILDTGATLTCLDTGLADELALEEVRGVTAVGGTVMGTGSVRLVEVPALEVGTARADDLRACVLDLAAIGKAGLEARGLLGLNFLKAYRLTVDFEASIVRFDRPGSAGAAPGS